MDFVQVKVNVPKKNETVNKSQERKALRGVFFVLKNMHYSSFSLVLGSV
jgi:hypothetical protein